MNRGGNIRDDHDEADQRAQTGGQTPGPVEGSHDGPSEQPFDADALCIERDVTHVPEGTEQEEADRQHIDGGRPADGQQGESIAQDTDLGHHFTAQAGHQIACQGDRYKLADGNQEEHKPPIEDVLFTGKERFDIGNTACPRGEAKPLRQEEGENGHPDPFF